MTALHATDLVRHFGERTALAGVSLSVQAGECVGLVGPSGAGKSTLLRTANGFWAPGAGRIEILGHDLAVLDRRGLRRLRAEIGTIYQQFNLIRRASALDNALSGAVSRTGALRTWLGRHGPAERRTALEALDRVGLLECFAQRADTLSGGQQQRVAIARTLVQGARVVLADEPVASLDPGSSENVLRLLRSLAHDDGAAVVVSLHQTDFALRYCDRIIGLHDGRVAMDVPAARVASDELDRLYGLSEKPDARDDRPARHMRVGA